MTIATIVRPVPLTSAEADALADRVAKLIGLKKVKARGQEFYASNDFFWNPDENGFNPTGDWNHGGPLVGEAGLNFRKVEDDHYEAWYTGCKAYKGTTHLHAAMLCLVEDDRSQSVFKAKKSGKKAS